jgi:hypothetical protein
VVVSCGYGTFLFFCSRPVRDLHRFVLCSNRGHNFYFCFSTKVWADLRFLVSVLFRRWFGGGDRIGGVWFLVAAVLGGCDGVAMAAYLHSGCDNAIGGYWFSFFCGLRVVVWGTELLWVLWILWWWGDGVVILWLCCRCVVDAVCE